jgi:hypothetical protein
MPISTPIAASGVRSPEHARRIPQAVRSACLQMIHEAVDFITAAKANGLRPDTLRRHLHRPEVVGFIRRERAAFGLAICAANEAVLAEIRDKGENAMARVRAVQVLEGIEDGQVAKQSNAPAPGVTVRIVNVVAPDTQATTIDVTPARAAPLPAPELAEPDADPIFTIDR